MTRDNELFILSDDRFSALNVFFAVSLSFAVQERAHFAEGNGVAEATSQLGSIILCLLRSCLRRARGRVG